ncbi:aminotransferase class I/II-fold pyridoxal phosphate-dependent enzyme [Granulicella sp. L60]|uniref:aminotransferase class I/II-fold pyridoxal phosphate-dependent enzyme n=1 Tax=Granulicella sp. L60 TaxID=1641866 RepID=UPI001C202F94|nr:aminotransferase class I/II-fold pyridoxal phosphate-dependent enzyme [Granulicella sp. L60]
MSLKELQTAYLELQERRLALDLTRGKPSPEQLDLSAELLSLPGISNSIAEGSIDIRNYGVLQGLREARQLFSSLLEAPPEQIVLANNSSLSLMHDVLVFALLKGTCDSSKPWSKQNDIAFICPVPGYDRHFKICEDYDIRMLPVQMHESGPDMCEVEKLVMADPAIKGMWCVPKYSNPTGVIYSEATVERLAAMETAAPDFRIFWDNAYAVHDLTDDESPLANLLERTAACGHPNRAFVFASTSKVTFAGAGICGVAASLENVRWLLARMAPRTIGPDKINQLRHVKFLKDKEGITALMSRHRQLLAPKFEAVLKIFEAQLSDLPNVAWTKPKGGYFITLEVPPGRAKRVVSLAREVGVVLTPAGATHPYGMDPEDRAIRIAPSFPNLAEVQQAAKVVALCVKLAVVEQI